MFSEKGITKIGELGRLTIVMEDRGRRLRSLPLEIYKKQSQLAVGQLAVPTHRSTFRSRLISRVMPVSKLTASENSG